MEIGKISRPSIPNVVYRFKIHQGSNIILRCYFMYLHNCRKYLLMTVSQQPYPSVCWCI